jgi:uncharacterized protein
MDFEKLKEEVAKKMNAPGHDFLHVVRVYNLAKKIGRNENCDMDILLAASLLHDIGRGEGVEHSKKSVEIAGEILRKIDFPEEKIRDVLYAISLHRYRDGITPHTLEGKILQDADRLDAIGAIGIIRCFTYGGAHGRMDYHPEDPFFETPRRLEGDRYSLDHFYDKLFKLKNTLHTEMARKIAEGRYEFMREFLRRLKDEIDSQS